MTKREIEVIFEVGDDGVYWTRTDNDGNMVVGKGKSIGKSLDNLIKGWFGPATVPTDFSWKLIPETNE